MFSLIGCIFCLLWPRHVGCVCVFRSYPQRWWRRVYVEEFYPMVHLGDSYLERMLVQHGLKVRNKSSVKSESVIKLGHILNVDNLTGEQTDLKFTVCYLQDSLIQQSVFGSFSLNLLKAKINTDIFNWWYQETLCLYL